jgi:hypothetical protein
MQPRHQEKLSLFPYAHDTKKRNIIAAGIYINIVALGK